MTDAAAAPTSPGDPAFPGLHIRPPKGWLNDPNGLSYVDGVYHAFFQYNPHSARHHRIVWGHASSTDLLTWHDEPVAFAPRPGLPDSHGCWSGSVTVDDGVPTAVYSGLVVDGGDSSVMLARSDRAMRDWVQEDEPVAGRPEGLDAVRDPFIVEVEGRRWAVQGAGTLDGRGAVIVHSCDDLHAWVYRGVLVSADHPVAAEHAPAVIWECPQLFQVDGTWVVMISPLIGTQGTPLSFDRVAWLAGDLRVEDGALRFEPVTGGRFDVGPDLYAPQVLALQNRVLTWGWIFEDGRTQEEVDAAGWAGLLSFPRELHVVRGRLESRPAPELTALRRRLLHDGPGDEGGVAVHDVAFEVVLEPRRRAVPVGIRLLLEGRGADDDAGRRLVAEYSVPDGAGLRALVDGSVIEVFVDGEPNRSSRAYPAAGEHWVVEVGGVGAPADAEQVSVWILGLPST